MFRSLMDSWAEILNLDIDPEIILWDEIHHIVYGEPAIDYEEYLNRELLFEDYFEHFQPYEGSFLERWGSD